MLKELGPILKTWQTTKEIPESPFSFLYSDIGKKFYAGLGWHPFPSTHIAFPPSSSSSPETAQRLECPAIEALCIHDESSIRQQLEKAKDGKTHIALVPNHPQMQWHHLREDFMTRELFGHSPTTKGAIAGPEGARVWAIWTRSFYGHLEDKKSGNTLHILRLVVENDTNTEENIEALKGVLEIAQREAEAWRLLGVEVWNPTSYVQGLIEGTGLEHKKIEREEESIASLMWYGLGSGKGDEIEWVGNEKYGWC